MIAGDKQGRPFWPVIALIGLLCFQLIRIISAVGSDMEAPYDDAFITLTYARNLVEGNGLVFNPGERVEGFSCFLWVMIGALGLALGFNGPVFLLVVSMGLALANVALCFWAAGRLVSADENIKNPARLYCAWVVILPSFVMYWALSGMETELCSVLLLLGTVLIYQDWFEKKKVSVLSGIVFALSVLTRSEGVFCFTFMLLFLIAMQAIKQRRLGASWLGKLMPGTAIVYGTYIAYLVFRLAYYGDILPTTHYAKVAWIWLNVKAWAFNVRHLAFGIGWPLLLIPFAFVSPQSRRVGAFLLAPLLFVFISGIGVGGNLGGGGYRLFVPYLPMLALLQTQGLMNAACFAKKLLVNPRLSSALPIAMVFLAVVLAPQTGRAFKAFVDIRSNAHNAKLVFKDEFKDEARLVGEWLRDNVPSSWRIAMDRIGRIPFYSRLHTLDMLGLTEPEIAKKPVTSGLRPEGQFAPAELHVISHSLKKDWEYALRTRPHIIIDRVPFNPQLASRVLEGYCESSLSLPGEHVLCFLLRRDLDGQFGLHCKDEGLREGMKAEG